MTNEPSDTKRQGRKQEDVFPAALIYIVCKIPVKWHKLYLPPLSDGAGIALFVVVNLQVLIQNQLDKDRISFRHTWLPG